jgi:hypothetical protein
MALPPRAGAKETGWPAPNAMRGWATVITLTWNGESRQMEFWEFARLAREGKVPPDAVVRGDVLTGGESVRAGELRTYAILRGLPLPPPRVIPYDPEEPNLDTTLDRIRWLPAERRGGA